MPTYNAYTKTNDFPIISDAWTILFGTPRPASASTRILSPSSPYFGQTEQSAAANEYVKLFVAWVQKHNIPQSVIDEWNRQALSNQSTEEQKNWWQRLADKVTNTVDNFVTQAGNVLQGAGESALLAPLLPFKVAMVNALKRKGEDVTLSTKLGKVASLFKQKIIDRSSTTNYLNHAEDGDGLTTDQILQLIDKIIPFFTLILEKVRSGTATSEERLINGDAESEAGKVTGGGEPTSGGVNNPIENDDWFSKYKWVIIGAVAVVLFLAFRKK